MERLFKRLRVIMIDNEYTQQQLARKLGMHHMSLGDRMRGKTPFKLDEMYAIMDLFDQPYEKLNEVFPHYPYNQVS